MTGAVDVDAQRRHRTSNPSQGGPRRGTNQQTDSARDHGHRPVRRRVRRVGALSHCARGYRRVLADLFSGDYKTLEVLKLKDIVDALEKAIDALESVANTVEQISVKES